MNLILRLFLITFSVTLFSLKSYSEDNFAKELKKLQEYDMQKDAWCDSQPLFDLNSLNSQFENILLEQIKFTDGKNLDQPNYDRLKYAFLSFMEFTFSMERIVTFEISDDQLTEIINNINSVNSTIVRVVGVMPRNTGIDVEIKYDFFLNHLISQKISEGVCVIDEKNNVLCEQAKDKFVNDLLRVIDCQIQKASKLNHNANPVYNVISYLNHSFERIDIEPLL